MSGLRFIHSPLVGPGTWRPVADLAGGDLPDLRSFVEANPPRWKAYVDLAIGGREPATVVVGHSGAGALLPAIAIRLVNQPRALIFVDAQIPPSRGHHLPSSELRQLLEEVAAGAAVLPRWSTWWGEEAMAELIPDHRLRARLADEEPAVPLSFYDEPIPVPDGWTDIPCGYVRLSSAYDTELEEAIARGWVTARLELSHLATVTNPHEVLDAIDSVIDRL